MEYKSKFKRGKITYFFVMISLLFSFICFCIAILFKGKVILSTIFILCLFLILIGLMILALKDFKYIKINTKTNKLYYESIIKPFGKEIDLRNYKGYFEINEIANGDSYNVVYLVDRNDYAIFKISGNYYDNFVKLINYLNLEEYNSNLGIKEYYRLLYFGKIKLKKTNENVNKTNNTVLKFLKNLIFLGLIVFVLMQVIKIISNS